jgi:hypothetical protein
LPIYDLLLSVAPAPLKPLLQPIVKLLTPVTRLLIDLGYDNTGDPSVPTPLSLLPFNPATFNPITFAGQFVKAIGQGICDAQHGISTLPAATTTTTTVAPSLDAKSISPADVTDRADSTKGLATVPDLATKKSTFAATATTAPVEGQAPATSALAESTITMSTPTTSTPTTSTPTTSATTKSATPTTTDATVSTAPAKTINPKSITQLASTGDATKTDVTKAAAKKDENSGEAAKDPA